MQMGVVIFRCLSMLLRCDTDVKTSITEATSCTFSRPAQRRVQSRVHVNHKLSKYPDR